MSAKKKVRAQASVRVDTYNIVARAVDEGAALGVRRAHKHTDTPGHEAIAEHVARAVMETLGDVLIYEP